MGLTVRKDGTIGLRDIISVAREGGRVELAAEVRDQISDNRANLLDRISSGEVIYGTNTGFGSLAHKVIPAEQTSDLQLNLLRSHACGVGDPLATDVVRGAMLLRLLSFCPAHSGVSLEVVDLLLEMLNRGVQPLVPSKGSVGASGDLAPLSHLALVLVGEGEAFLEGEVVSGKEALAAVGLKPVTLSYKEGLGLINGTAVSTCLASLALADAYRLFDEAVVSFAMALEALCAYSAPFDERVFRVRPHPGMGKVMATIRNLIAGSTLVDQRDPKVHLPQDSYVVRCAPQVLGAVVDNLDHIRSVLAVEMMATTDNPLVFDDAVISAGNFHGEPVGIVADLLGSVLTNLGNWAERLMAKLVDANHNHGLPGFLVTRQPGLNSGYMIPQYVAASLLTENKVLAHPASIDSIPTSANQEDYVSMSATAALKARTIVENTEHIVSFLAMTASRALHVRLQQSHKEAAPALAPVQELIEKTIAPHLPRREDPIFYPIVRAVAELVTAGRLSATAGSPPR